jgi:hypothetical protein
MAKRIFLAFALCFCFTTHNLVAQARFGLKGGLNLTKGGFDDDSETQFALRFHAGVSAQNAFDDKFYLRTEFFFAQKGWKASANALNPEGVSLTINYLNLPLLLGYNIHEKISLFVGPEIGFKLSAKRKPSQSSWKDVIEKLDVGIAAGTNVRLSENFGLDLRYVHGFKGLYKGLVMDVNNMPTGEVMRVGRNQAIELGVFYIF